MSNQDDDFNARIKRLRLQPKPYAQMPDRSLVGDKDFDENAISGAILRPQLALILGAVAMIAGRGFAMNYLLIEPSTELLGWGEGAIVLLLLLVIGLLFGKSELISHGALVVGASMAFLGESYYIPLVPELMESIYNPDYVSLVLLNAR
jgi:hypothetical protein